MASSTPPAKAKAKAAARRTPAKKAATGDRPDNPNGGYGAPATPPATPPSAPAAAPAAAPIVLGERNGRVVRAVVTADPWDIGADAIVVVRTPGLAWLAPTTAPTELVDVVHSVALPARSPRALADANRAYDVAVRRILRSTTSLQVAVVLSPEPGRRTAMPGDEAVRIAVGDAVRAAAKHGCRRLLVQLPDARAEIRAEPEAIAEAAIRGIRPALLGIGEARLEAVDIVITDAELVDVLRQAAAEARPREPANDLPVGEDLFGTQVEAESLADILLLRELQPPLALGILGGWGTGKSFVMHLMRRRMNEIRARPVPRERAWAPRDDPNGPPPEYVGHVYQIEFNAWTYAHDDLWAGLMQRILEELNRQLTLERRLVEAGVDPLEGGDYWRALDAMADDERDAVLAGVLAERPPDGPVNGDVLWQNLQKVQAAELSKLRLLSRQRDELQEKVTDARAAVEQAADAHLARVARRAAWEPLLQELSGALGVTPETVKQVLGGEQAHMLLAGRRRLPVPSALRIVLARRRHDVLALLAFVAVTAAAATFAAALGAVPLVAAVVGAFPKLSRWHTAFAAAAADFDERVARERARQEATRAQVVEQKIDELRPELHALERDLAAQNTAVEQQRRAVGPAGEFVSAAAFIEARLQKGEYDQRLGLIRQVQLDLQQLTNAFTVFRKDVRRAEKQGMFPRGPARVVLYIDDLDRCPPKRVVEVFEAIQLLLTTKLFVVVLAIDLRYVARALEAAYDRILSRFGEPSGLDYIEKIIQLPYRTQRVRPDGARRFLAWHLTPVDDEAVAVGPDAAAEATVETAAEMIRSRASTGGDTNISRLIEFSAAEARLLEVCCTVVDLPPRAMKRLVNVLKVVKLVWARRDIPAPSPLVTEGLIVLLVLAARHGDVARGAIQTLQRVPTAPPVLLIDALAGYALPTHDHYLTRDFDLWAADVAALRETRVPQDAAQPLGQVVLHAMTHALDFVAAFSFLGDVGYDAGLHLSDDGRTAPSNTNAKGG